MTYVYVIELQDKTIPHSCAFSLDSVHATEEGAKEWVKEFEEETPPKPEDILVWTITRKILHA